MDFLFVVKITTKVVDRISIWIHRSVQKKKIIYLMTKKKNSDSHLKK